MCNTNGKKQRPCHSLKGGPYLGKEQRAAVHDSDSTPQRMPENSLWTFPARVEAERTGGYRDPRIGLWV